MNICLLGNNLTNLVLANIFLRKKINVDIVSLASAPPLKNTIRTIAISSENYKFLKENIKDFENKTFSLKANKILKNFEAELKNFKQVCPVEMLDKLENPISLKPHIKKAG